MFPHEPTAYQLRKSDYKIGFGFISNLTCKLPFYLPGIQLSLSEVQLNNSLLLFSLNSDISLYASLNFFLFCFNKCNQEKYHGNFGEFCCCCLHFLFRFLRKTCQKFLMNAFGGKTLNEDKNILHTVKAGFHMSDDSTPKNAKVAT